MGPSKLVCCIAWPVLACLLTQCQAEYRVLQDRPDRLMVELPNRMIVIAQELHTSPVVTARVFIKTGSIYEQQHVGAGLSHFLEHLASGGTTEKRTEEQSNEVLGRIGAVTNASTGLTRVRYYINTTSDHADEAIDLLADWLQHSRIEQREFDRERDVIQREFEMGRGEPRRIFWKLTQQARYRMHPARHPTIGYIDDFLKVTRDDIYDFYKKMYVPNNMVFVVAGDIDRHRVVDQIARLCGDAPPGELPAIEFPVERSIEEPRSLSDTADIKRARLRLAWPGTRLAGEGDYALDLLAVVLGQGESSRLVRIVRDEHRAVNTIDAFNLSFAWGRGFFAIDAEIADIRTGPDAPPMSAEQAIDTAGQLILEQVKRIRSHGVTAEELARAKRSIMADVIYGGQSVQALADRLATDMIGTGDPDYLRRYAGKIQALTAADLDVAANRFLTNNRLITVTLLPDKSGQKPTPLARPDDSPQAGPRVREKVDLDNALLVQRFRENAALDDANARIISDDVERHVLPNGLRLLIGRSTLVPAVSIQMYQVGGLLSDPPGQEGLTKAFSRMRIRGTATRSAEQIAQQIESFGASLATNSGYNTSFTNAVCLKPDLAQVMELFSDVVLNPSYPADEWRKMKPRLLAAIDREMDSWYGELRHHFRKTYFGDFPWAQTPLGRRVVIEKLTAEQLKAAYQRRVGAGETVLAVFGDVDPPRVLSMVEKLFANLPAQPVAPFNFSVPAAPQKSIQQFATRKPLGAAQIGFGPGISRDSADYPAVQVLTRVLSRFPTGWLDRALRGEGEGLVYAVGCGQFTGLAPGYIGVMFNASTERLGEALTRTGGVIRRVRDELIDDRTLSHARAAVLTREFLGKQSNSDRASSYAIDELYGLGQHDTERFIRRVGQLDAESLRSVARQYLQNPVAVILSSDPLPGELLDAVADSLATGPDK